MQSWICDCYTVLKKGERFKSFTLFNSNNQSNNIGVILYSESSFVIPSNTLGIFKIDGV